MQLLKQCSNDTVIIDALLGTGIDRAVEGQYAEAINLINSSGLPVVAVDIPSGLNADTGSIMGCAVRAAVTCTFIAPKQGLYTGDARDMCGEIEFDDLDVPAELYSRVGQVVRLTSPADIGRSLVARPVNSHKGLYGAVAVIGGSPGMTGAALLSARAALRCGAGMVKISVFPGQQSSAYTVLPEAMTALLGTPDALQSLKDWASVIAIGPGLGLTTEATDLFESAIVSDKPKVIDADGLSLLARSHAKLSSAVLTPHPGEAARLLDCSTADVQKNRFQSAAEIARRYSSVCILKGAGSIVADATGARALCAAGNPGMASAGMGDVLTGVVAALLAQGLDPLSAASVGVQLHAMAGDRAAESGQRGLLASDVIDELRGCLNP